MDKELENSREEWKDGEKKKETTKEIEEDFKEDKIEETIKDVKKEQKEESTGDLEEKLLEEQEDHSKEAIEESKEKSIKKSITRIYNQHKYVFVGIGIVLCTLVAMYFGIARYFIDHFYFGSEINGVSVYGKTIQEVEELMESELQTYSLSLKGRGGKIERIDGKDIGLKYVSNGEVKKFKDDQNPFRWIIACFNKENTKLMMEFSYKEKLLKDKIDKLSFFESESIIEPKNPSFQYIGNRYEIIDEVVGNKVNKEALYTHITKSIPKGERELDLEALDCYIKPQYTSTSKETITIKDTLNKYVSSKITYTYGNRKKIVDGSVIHKWLSVDENYEIIIHKDKVEKYINELAKMYNTIGKTRNFVTSSGKTVKVSGGDYGSAIHQEKEVEHLISAIKEGKTLSRKPEYRQKPFSHGEDDIGNTYVEINLAQQYIWFYKNGKLVTKGDVVTGNVSKNHTTPKGIYRLKYKARNVVLRGPDYAAPVTFWMPFNGGIGMHDASWRSSFGGNIYKTNGSHGCINCPYNVAKAIYHNIEPGTPVICY